MIEKISFNNLFPWGFSLCEIGIHPPMFSTSFILFNLQSLL